MNNKTTMKHKKTPLTTEVKTDTKNNGKDKKKRKYIAPGECFLRTYSIYFTEFRASSFKEIMVTQLKSKVDDVVEGMIAPGQYRNTPQFYLSNYAMGTSAFLKQIETTVNLKQIEATVNAPENTNRGKVYVKYFDCENSDFKNVVHSINESILQETSGEDVTECAKRLILQALIKNSGFQNKEEVDANNQLNIVFCHNWRLRIGEKGRGNVEIIKGTNKLGFLIDHLDRYFIAGFTKRVEENKQNNEELASNNEFTLNNINRLRKLWYSVLKWLETHGIHCIASTLTDLEIYFGERSNSAMLDEQGRIRTSSVWRALSEQDAFFCDIKDKMREKNSSIEFECLEDGHQCEFCLLRGNISPPLKRKDAISNVKMFVRERGYRAIFDKNRWLMCRSFYHAFSPDNGCNNMDYNLKSYYKNKNNSRTNNGNNNATSLLEDYLYALPLYIAEIVPKLARTNVTEEDISRKIEVTWNRISSRFYKNVVKLLETYVMRYQKKKNEEKAGIKENMVKKILTRRLHWVCYEKNKRDWLAKCFTNIIAQRDIFSRNSGKYWARPFMRYLYSEETIFEKQNSPEA